MLAADTKTCPRCETSKLLDEFHNDAAKRDGHASYCKDCACAKARDWAEANPERRKTVRDAYYIANRDEILEKTSAWQAANIEKVREYAREGAKRRGHRDRRAYAKAHPEISRKQAQMRRARIVRAVIVAGVAEYERLVRLDPCSYCGAPGGSADHIVPLSNGGEHSPLNLTGACHACNSGKREKSLLHFLLRKAAI